MTDSISSFWLEEPGSRLPIWEFLGRVGQIFATFDAATQTSGNVSYGARVGERRFFVKTAGDPAVTGPISHAARVGLLRNAIELRRSVCSRLLPELRGVVESPLGPALVYDWEDGELLYASGEQRKQPSSALQRFCALPKRDVLAALELTYSLHEELADAGWVASDFYDGCFLYDFERRSLHLIDLDHYQRGAFVNERGRMPGSTRFMAPEEFRAGARIDQRTTVFNLGRAARVFLSGSSGCAGESAENPQREGVLRRACAQEPEQRYATVAAFARAWRDAHSGVAG